MRRDEKSGRLKRLLMKEDELTYARGSELYREIRRAWSELGPIYERGGVSWVNLADKLGRAGFKDTRGNSPSARAVRGIVQRVARDEAANPRPVSKPTIATKPGPAPISRARPDMSDKARAVLEEVHAEQRALDAPMPKIRR
jgi:hypothetical protein